MNARTSGYGAGEKTPGELTPPPPAAVTAPDPRLLTTAGHYYSTHCLHEHHDQCKATCKHCPAHASAAAMRRRN